MGILICTINGQTVQAPEGWQGVQTLMTWDNESVQANITTTNFTFVADAAQVIYTGFLQSAFEGISITFEDVEDDGSSFVFDGYIDFTDGFEVIAPNDLNEVFKIKCNIKEKNQIDTFKAKAAGTTFALLENQGFINSSDFQKLLYVIQKPFDPMEELMIAIQIAQTSLNIARIGVDVTQIYTATTAITGTAGIGSAIAGPVYGIVMTIVEGIYATLTLIQLIILWNKILQILLPMPRYGKVISLRRYFEKACAGLGFSNFSSSIAELNSYYIFPSKDVVVDNNPFNSPSTDTGYFNTKDYGYLVGEFIQACEKLFRAKIKIDVANNTIHFEPLLNDAFWLTASTYKAPDVFIQGYKPNTNEIAATRLIKFETDDFDQWTKENYSGTAYEIHTNLLTVTEPKFSLLKGYEETSVAWALGNQKAKKNLIETVVSSISTLFAAIANLFGLPVPTYLSAYKHISKALKISQDITKLPKLLACDTITEANAPYLVLKNNQRDKLSAKYLYDNFIIDASFVANSYRGQWKLYENISIPFSRSAFVAIGNNNYFQDMNGALCRMDKVEWEHGKDRAVVSYRVRESYTTNLTETFINP